MLDSMGDKQWLEWLCYFLLLCDITRKAHTFMNISTHYLGTQEIRALGVIESNEVEYVLSVESARYIPLNNVPWPLEKLP